MEYAKKRLETKGTLTKSDFEKLYKSCKDSRLAQKYHALLLGFDYEWKEVANILHRSYKQIRKWVKKYNKYGLDGLKSDKQKGNDPKLSVQQKAELKEIVSNDPRDKGYNFSNWNSKNLKEIIKEKFSVLVSQETIRRVLHALGFVWKRPEHKFVLSNKKEKEEFKKKVIETIENRKDDEVILFEDECTARQHPTLKNMWIIRGMRSLFRHSETMHRSMCLVL